mmetsp:Transcript_10992/g.26412  ORF Transcript_10992/g.26412 Transcript_10992/m.26412 type:complete len:220 (+) Transcript_10992:5546-6205(+)
MRRRDRDLFVTDDAVIFSDRSAGQSLVSVPLPRSLRLQRGLDGSQFLFGSVHQPALAFRQCIAAAEATVLEIVLVDDRSSRYRALQRLVGPFPRLLGPLDQRLIARSHNRVRRMGGSSPGRGIGLGLGDCGNLGGLVGLLSEPLSLDFDRVLVRLIAVTGDTAVIGVARSVDTGLLQRFDSHVLSNIGNVWNNRKESSHSLFGSTEGREKIFFLLRLLL